MTMPDLPKETMHKDYLLNDRITGTLEYYRMSTKDMIMKQPLSNFTGFENIVRFSGTYHSSISIYYILTITEQMFDSVFII